MASIAAKLLPKVSPAIASAKRNFDKLYCRLAIAANARRDSQVIGLPIVDLPVEQLASIRSHDDIFVDIQDVAVRHIEPELYFYFTRFDSIYSNNFREVLASWGYRAKPSYNIVDADGNVLTLVTTSQELYCYNLFSAVLPATTA